MALQNDQSPPPSPLERFEYAAAELMANTPPRWHHPNKAVAAVLSCPPDALHRGTLVYTRWPTAPLSSGSFSRLLEPVIEFIEGVMDYAAADGHQVHWQVNFADPELFFGYSSSLFAQDEWQVLEHPALGALRERLKRDGRATNMLANESHPGGAHGTPVLVSGVERRCEFLTRVGSGAGNGPVKSLYGRGFSVASPEVIRQAVRVIDPPTFSNIIAIAAPAPELGRYTLSQIEQAARTALTGFAAAVASSPSISHSAPAVVINTGFWGCGAFGGHRVLMSIVQLIAARAAGVAKVRFFAPAGDHRASFEQAQKILDDLLLQDQSATVGVLLSSLAKMGFQWGQSDGN